MHSKLLLPALLVAGIAQPGIAKPEPEATPLETVSAWQLDYGETECRMMRKFDVGEEKTALVQFNRDGPLSTFNLAIRAPDTPSARDFRARNATIRFDGDTDWMASIVTRSKATNGQEFMVFPRLPASFWEGFAARLKENRPVVLRIGVGSLRMAFDLQKMRAVKAEFDKCEDALLSKDGLDGSTLRSLRQPAKPVVSSMPWLNSNDYPKSKAFLESEGAVFVRLDVNETGAVTACRVIDAIGDEAFRKLTCDRLMQRAKFDPAISASGTAVKSYHQSVVFWVMDRDR